MKLVFIGDVVGRSGREALEAHLPTIKQRYQPDVIVVNGENAASGHGITMKIAKSFFEWGTDIITTGNHVWKQRELLSHIGQEPRLLRPHNFPKGTIGSGVVRYQLQSTGQHIVVVNLMGRVFMDHMLDDPFAVMEDILKTHRLGQNCDALFVDFHAEATSEKMAFAHFCDGRVSAVIGTHTHIPTADTIVLPGGTAYQSDAGMTGDYDSVIGVVKEIPIHNFVKQTPGDRMRPASGPATVCGALVEIGANGLARSITPIRIGGILPQSDP